jgi:integrase
MAVILLYTTGMRRGELLRLTLADCEPESGVLRVRESKFHKSRILPLSSDAHAELCSYLRKRLAPPFSRDPDTPLLINTEGGLRAYTGTGISGGIHALFKMAGVEDSEGRRPRIHDLRHSFASFGAGGGLGLPIVGKLLGHASAVTTARYAHLDADPLRAASERIGGTIAAAIGEQRHRRAGTVVKLR